jgi:hypothetical protein
VEGEAVAVRRWWILKARSVLIRGEKWRKGTDGAAPVLERGGGGDPWSCAEMRSHGEQARWRQFCLWSLKVEDGGELGLVGGLELDGLVG